MPAHATLHYLHPSWAYTYVPPPHGEHYTTAIIVAVYANCVHIPGTYSTAGWTGGLYETVPKDET